MRLSCGLTIRDIARNAELDPQSPAAQEVWRVFTELTEYRLYEDLRRESAQAIASAGVASHGSAERSRSSSGLSSSVSAPADPTGSTTPSAPNRSPVSALLMRRLARRAGLELELQLNRWGPQQRFGVPRHRDMVSILRKT